MAILYIITGSHVRQLRKTIGLSRQEFADEMRVSVSALSFWEQGRRVAKAKYQKRMMQIAKRHGIRLEELEPISD